MKLALFDFGKKAIFPQLIKNLLYNINVEMAWILDINKDIIKINNGKDVELLGQDFIDITCKASWYIGERKKHYQELEVVVSNPKSRYLFIAFFNSHLIVDTCEIKLSK